MAGNLRMDTTEFNNIATSIGTENTNIGDCITAIQKAINDLNRTWTGEAYTAAKTKIDNFYTKTFIPYKDAVQGYIDFINTTKTTYDSTEDALKSNVNQINEDALGKFSE